MVHEDTNHCIELGFPEKLLHFFEAAFVLKTQSKKLNLHYASMSQKCSWFYFLSARFTQRSFSAAFCYCFLKQALIRLSSPVSCQFTNETGMMPAL